MLTLYIFYSLIYYNIHNKNVLIILEESIFLLFNITKIWLNLLSNTVIGSFIAIYYPLSLLLFIIVYSNYRKDSKNN